MKKKPQDALVISKKEARRLAVTCQNLDAPRLAANETDLETVLRSLSYLQLDPVSVVAPSHELVLWSRLGDGAVPLLEEMLWQKRSLFEYWLSNASIVRTDDYPMYQAFMDAHPAYPEVQNWVDANHELRQHILDRLNEEGTLPAGGFEDLTAVPWKSSGWTDNRNVERMLTFLGRKGIIMVAGRLGGERLWALTDALIPPKVNRTALPMDKAIATGVEHSLRALGVARETDIRQYFFLYAPRIPIRETLNQLHQEGRVIPVKINGVSSPQKWYVHSDKLDTLEAIQSGDWQGRTTLLSPFDNLISGRKRTEKLWDFEYKNEMYVPKEKRQYGYYVLPILHDDQLVGRIAPRVDRNRQVLLIEGLYVEPDVDLSADLYDAVMAQISDLAAFTGAEAIEFSDTVPEQCRGGLRH